MLAVLVAVGLVWGALEVRDRATDDGSGDAGDDDATAVVCVRELEDVCGVLGDEHDDLQVSVEDAGATLAALSASDPPEPFAWVTLQPWPAMVRDRRGRGQLGPLLGEGGEALGHTSLVLATWGERVGTLTTRCGMITWRCVGEIAAGTWANIGGQEEWGAPKPTLADPTTSAGGLLALHQAVASRLDRGYSVRDFEGAAFFSWFSTLGGAVVTPAGGGSAVEAMVVFGVGQHDLAGGLEAEVDAFVDRAGARAGGLEVVPGEPPVAAEVVAVPVGDVTVPGSVREGLAELLSARGWRPGAAPADDVPDAGVLEALRTEWSEVIG